MTEGNCKGGEWGKEGLWGVTLDGDSKGRCYRAGSPRMQTLGHSCMPEELGAVFLGSILVGD